MILASRPRGNWKSIIHHCPIKIDPYLSATLGLIQLSRSLESMTGICGPGASEAISSESSSHERASS